jgi:hypothetical protein
MDAIVASSAMTVRLGKAAFYEQRALNEPAGYEMATEVMTDNARRADAQKCIRAFVQKNPPVWTGE